MHAITQGFGTETGKYDGVNRADAHSGQHQHDRLGKRRQINGDAVAFLNAHPAQSCRHALDLVQQLRIREHPPLAALVKID